MEMNHVWLESGDYEDYVVPLSRSKTFSLCDQPARRISCMVRIK